MDLSNSSNMFWSSQKENHPRYGESRGHLGVWSNTLLRTDSMLPEQINVLGKLLTWPTCHSLDGEWQRRNAAVVAISQYCGHLEGGPLRGRKRVAPSDELEKRTEQDKCRLPKQAPSLPKYRWKRCFWRGREIIFGKPKNLDDVFNAMETASFPSIVGHRNIANTNRPCDTFEDRTWRIGDVIYAARIFSMKCIYAGTQKMFIVSLPNGITIQKTNQNRISIQTEVCDLVILTRVKKIWRQSGFFGSKPNQSTQIIMNCRSIFPLWCVPKDFWVIVTPRQRFFHPLSPKQDAAKG